MSKIFGFGNRLNNLTIGAKTILAGAGLFASSVTTQVEATNTAIKDVVEVTRGTTDSMPSVPNYTLRPIIESQAGELIEVQEENLGVDQSENYVVSNKVYSNGRVLNQKPQALERKSSMDVVSFCRDLENLSRDQVVSGLIEKVDSLNGYVYEYFKNQMLAHKQFLLNIRAEITEAELKENFEKKLEQVLEVSFEDIKLQQVEIKKEGIQDEINELVLSPNFNNLNRIIQKITTGDVNSSEVEDPILKKAVESGSVSLFALSYVRSVLASNFDPESPNFLSILRPNSVNGKDQLVAINEVLSRIDNADNEKLIKSLLLDPSRMNFLPAKLANSKLFTRSLSSFLNPYVNLGEAKNPSAQIDLTVLSILYSTEKFPNSDFSRNTSGENRLKALSYVRSRNELTQALSGILS